MNKRSIGLGLAVIVVAVFATIQYSENKNYEEYLSHQLLNNISIFSSSTIFSGVIVDDVIKKESITQTQLDSLRNKFEQISKKGRMIVELSDSLHKVDNTDYNIHPYPIYMMSDFYYVIDRLGSDSEKETEDIELTDEQVEQFKLMKDVIDVWGKVLEENIAGIHLPDPDTVDVEYGGVKQGSPGGAMDTYFDTYREGMVDNKDWINMIEQIQQQSMEFEKEVELIF